jgi:hypothetical protein
MARPCTVCRHHRLPEIAADMANGVTDVAIAERYGLARSSVQRHRQHVGTPSSKAAAERKGAAFTALASLPSADEVGAAYSSIAARIDAIAARAEKEGSLAVALMGLKELRSTVTAQAHLAGHVGSGATVQVNTQVNVDMNAAVRELIAAVQPAPRSTVSLPDVALPLVGAIKPDVDMLARLEAIIDGE